MTQQYKVFAPNKNIKGNLKLTGSKSIANRVLLIRALTERYFEIENISESDDTNTLIALLNSDEYELDAHHAGTTFRFMTAFLAIKGEERILTGSSRMKQRPVGPLVNALNSLGCNVEYLENEGYPPLKFGPLKSELNNEVSVPGNISSQYLSALLMIAPVLPRGLKLTILDDLVSRPYLEMTLSVMGYFGVSHTWEDNVIAVAHQQYTAKPFFVEADWSGASYFYSIASMSESAEIVLEGLSKDSLQGDSAIAKISESFGIQTIYENRTVKIIKKKGAPVKELLEYDFIKQPDIAQTVFAMCAAQGMQGLFTGLQTLFIKETDRIKAFQTELAKVNVYLSKVPSRFINSEEQEYYMVDGKASYESIPEFDTYQDHRMAMALAPLALQHTIAINEPGVVSKSYPEFWNDLKNLGFDIEESVI
jgi:3-phosphoshikimate 1-carboxyvinyltransferase